MGILRIRYTCDLFWNLSYGLIWTIPKTFPTIWSSMNILKDNFINNYLIFKSNYFIYFLITKSSFPTT